MEYFEHILRSKDHTPPTVTRQWTLKVVSERDFLRVLEQRMPTAKESPSQSSYNPECLELIAINLLKTPENPSRSLNTPTVLSKIPDEDIIEVFI